MHNRMKKGHLNNYILQTMSRFHDAYCKKQEDSETKFISQYISINPLPPNGNICSRIVKISI